MMTKHLYCSTLVLFVVFEGLAEVGYGQTKSPPIPPNASSPDGVQVPASDEPSQLLHDTEASDRWTQDLGRIYDRLDELEHSAQQRAKEEASRKSADAKRPTVKWTGQLQFDNIWVNQDSTSKATFGDIENGEAFRRARFGMFGDYDLMEYRIEMDFAQAGRPTFLDVYLGMKDLPSIGRIRAGHFFEPFSLERLTSNRFTTFLERSLPDQAFAPARNTGIAIGNNWCDGYGTWAAGLFRTDSDVFGDDSGDNFENAITTRGTWLPWYDDESGRHYAHLGAAYSFRGANNEQVRFRSQPETRIGAAIPNIPYFVDTGNIAADSYQLVGLEAAWVYDRVSFQSEYVLTPVDSRQQGTLYFQSWYLTASLFLTDDYRPYRKDFGIFDRVQPQRAFLKYRGSPDDKCLEYGPGAWEIAMRVSQLDLNDGPIQGGYLTDMTLGLNWYLNPYTRISANWVRAFLNSPNSGRSSTDFFGIRTGFEF